MSEKVKLTGKEKSELWIEGIVTVILLLIGTAISADADAPRDCRVALYCGWPLGSPN